jgi:predicted nuclease of predicted toxin-antitoxin system
MRFLLDENFPKSAAVFLQSFGHEVFDLRGSGDEGIEDFAVFQKALDF